MFEKVMNRKSYQKRLRNCTVMKKIGKNKQTLSDNKIRRQVHDFAFAGVTQEWLQPTSMHSRVRFNTRNSAVRERFKKQGR